MKSEKLYPSDLTYHQEKFQASQLVIPLFATHSEAKKAFFRQTRKGESWQLDFQNHQIYIAIQRIEKSVTLTNLLFVKGQPSWTKVLQALENFLRQQFVEDVLIPVNFGEAMSTWLLQQGYHQTTKGMQKQFVYHRGLVLGGGGAKGAYQIGVWQALKSENITFEVITGTSVGALNGALVLLDDVEVARDLWLTISTDKVLAYPDASKDSQSLKALLQQINSLATTAMRENGASTEPLQKLLRNLYNQEKMSQYPAKFFLCTTRFPTMQETVHEFDVSQGVSELDWLIGSASFYPAMMPKQIGEYHYVDGGYRNNIPIDVAIAQGVTECICIDVKGPGITKKVEIPEHVAITNFRTPWTLGNLLVFDRERSELNYRLGYLETMKTLGHFKGYWYTFSQGTNWRKDWRGFLQSLQEEPLYLALIQQTDFWKKITKIYLQKAPVEEGGLILMELIGRVLEITPGHVYTQETFLEALQNAYQAEQPAMVGSLSVGEWLQQLHNQRFVLSEKNQLIRLYQTMQEKGEIPPQVLTLVPIVAVAAKFLSYLAEKEEKQTI